MGIHKNGVAFGAGGTRGFAHIGAVCSIKGMIQPGGNETRAHIGEIRALLKVKKALAYIYKLL